MQFPRLHFLLPALAPLSSPRAAPASAARIDGMFTDAVCATSLLLDVRAPTLAATRARTLAAAFLVRGDVPIADVSRNLARLGGGLCMAPWNEHGFKVGLCRVPPANQPHGLLALFNSTAVGGVLDEQRRRFDRLYSRRAHLHHYTQFIEQGSIDEARDNVVALIAEYAAVAGKRLAERAEQPLDRAIPLS